MLGAAGLFFFPRASTIPELIAWGALIYAIQIGGVGAIFTYVTEQFPTHLRATATGWANAIGRVGMFISGPLLGFLIASLGWQNAYAIGAAVFVLSAVLVVALGIETKGMSLEELAPTVTQKRQ